MHHCHVWRFVSRSSFAALAAAALLAAPLTASADRILLDFGDAPMVGEDPDDGNTNPDANGHHWNTHEDIEWGIFDGRTVELIRASDGANTGITFAVDPDDPFDARNGVGVDAGPSLDYPDAATGDSFINESNGTSTFTLGGLDTTGLTYDLTFFAARAGSDGNRETQWEVTGGNKTEVVSLNPLGNTDTTVTAAGLTPDSSGEIVVTQSHGPANDSQWNYLGVLDINVVPEPTSLSLVGLGGLALLRRRRKA